MQEPEVKRDLKYLPFMVKKNNGAPMISVKYKDEMRGFVCSISTYIVSTIHSFISIDT